MLKIVQAVETLLHHFIQLVQILFPFGLSLVSIFENNATKNFLHHHLGLKPQISKRLGGYDRWEKAAHGLLGAAVGIVDQVGKSVQHGHGQTWCDLKSQLSGVSTTVLREIEQDCGLAAPHLA